MAIDRWFIGGGAEHSAESARRLVYASTSGAEGVAGTEDLRVEPLNPPGQGVRVLTGSGLIRSRYVGGEAQTYMGTVYKQETVSTNATSSTKSRTDMVIMNVEDPFAAGSKYNPPADRDIPTSQYVYIRVVSGVPAKARKIQDVPGYENATAITLARLNVPANTATITESMIEDVREVANPRRIEVVHARPRIAADNGAQTRLGAKASDGGEYFPGGGGFANTFSVDVPEWANRMIIDASWMAVSQPKGANQVGHYWMEFGDEYRDHTWPNKQQYEKSTQKFVFNSVNMPKDGYVEQWQLMDNVTIPKKFQGKKITFAYKAGYTGTVPPSASRTFMDAYSGLGCRITFVEVASDWDWDRDWGEPL